MIKTRLLNLVPNCKKYIAIQVLCQWLMMIVNVAMIFSFGKVLDVLLQYTSHSVDVKSAEIFKKLFMAISISAFAIVCRFVFTLISSRMSFKSASKAKTVLRKMIYEKLLKIGTSYNEKVATSEIVQLATEGVEQLESYFGLYVPQFFYALLAPITLFVILSRISMKASVALLICVPLIPLAIASVQTFAKKLLSKYWGQYANLGEVFLENIQALTTLKTYQADEYKNKQMNDLAEKFRNVTMKVLSMQLNSITIMDIVAYGGAAVGIVISVIEFAGGQMTLGQCFCIVTLCAEFFIPMRQLGSFFHVAMNGMAASDKIFRLIDLPLEKENAIAQNETATQANVLRKDTTDTDKTILLQNVNFSYDGTRTVLHDICFAASNGALTAIVGESGSGKSTIAQIISGARKKYSGRVLFDGKSLSAYSDSDLCKKITYVGFASYIFKGTLKENLLFAQKTTSDEELWQALEKAQLSSFVKDNGGLEMKVESQATNLSGGQRQRLALARAFLHDSDVYIFDEATSNIDTANENKIMAEIKKLARNKIVIVITHRLFNVKDAEKIYVMANGKICGSGEHEKLLAECDEYKTLWQKQNELEMLTQKSTNETASKTEVLL